MGLVGALIGSFITLITYRLPRARDVVKSRSRCAQCGRTLAIIDLIPIISFAMQRGVARCCKKKISWRYPLCELACAFSAVVIMLCYGTTSHAIIYCLLVWAVIALFITDLEHQIILDEIQLFLLLLGIVFAIISDRAIEDIATGALAGLAIGLTLKYGFLYLREKDGLGLGDVKFLCVAGVWLPAWQAFVPFLFYAGVLGIMSALLWRKLGHGERFPFGPALALSLLACVMLPDVARGFFTLYGVLAVPPLF